MTTKPKPVSRASLIRPPSPSRRCRACERLITTTFKNPKDAVAVNEYKRGKWFDTYVVHLSCYVEKLKEPYGPAQTRSKRSGHRVMGQ